MFIPSIKSIFIIILSLVILFLSYFYTQNYFSDISTKTLIIFLSSFFLAILILDFILSKMFSSKSKIHHSDLFSSIKNKSLDDFKQYLSKNRLSITTLSTMTYYGNVSLLNYCMANNSYDIFIYLLENGIDLNFSIHGSEPPIIFAAYLAKKKFIEAMLKYKNRIDCNVTTDKFKANAIEIAVWRGRSKVVQMLLRSGVPFSIEKYNSTICGKELLPFDKVKKEVKEVLVREHIFKLKKNQLNFHDKYVSKELKLNVFNNTRAYLIENFLLNS